MNQRSVLTLLLAVILTIWSGNTFLHSFDHGLLWKQILSGTGFLIFGALCVFVAVKLFRKK